MKNHFLFRIVFLILLLSYLPATAQEQFTPYDEFPGIIKDYKPAFEDDFPVWAKMLYSFPVNYNEITKEFSTYFRNYPDQKDPITRYYKIWSKAIESYSLPDGTILIPDWNTYKKHLLETQMGVSNGQKLWDDANWTFLGPKETFWLNEAGSPDDPLSCPWQVNVYAFDVASTNDEILFCGTETGYVNKTTDGGLTWQLLAPDYPFGGGVTAVTIHPINPDIVYVSAGNQIHKSIDGGLIWLPLLQSGNTFYPNSLEIDSEYPQKIYSSSGDGIHISLDDGINWTEKWSAACWDVDIKPDDHNIIYALSKNSGNFALALSTDGGQNFNLEPSFPSSIVESSGGLIAVTEADPDLLFVIMLSADNTPYLYKGDYNGGNWIWTLMASGQTPEFGMNNGQGYFDLVLDVSPNDPEIIMVGTTTLFKSFDGGSNFSAVGGYYGNFSIHPDIQDIKMLSNGKTWVSTDGGMNLTTDDFTLQTNYHVRVNGLIGSDMWGFDQGWNEDLVVGGRYHNGNTAIADFYQPKALRMGGAESPTGWVVQGRSRHAAFNDLGNGWILPETAESKPEGRFIFSKYPTMDEYGGRRGNIVSHPNYYGTLFLGEETGFWKSTDMGVSYDLLYSFPNKVRYLQISYSNPLVLYADVVNYGLYKSEDGGSSWTLKPALCSSPHGSSYWKGKLFFTISSYDENLIYACLQNGTWSSDIGKVFRSEDGGDTWEDWTGTLNEYTKCLCVQPSNPQTDIVYLFTQSRGGSLASVYYRTDGMSDWESYDENYPAGMSVNLAMPFFRDGKIRVAGNAGVWESGLKEPEFEPIINPWVERDYFNCMLDTLYFDDHSIMNHEGVSWTWDIVPEPLYIENENMRNPMVVLGEPGTYTVSLEVNKNGDIFTKTIPDMITASTCPSIEDCSNPAELPKDIWELIYVDSEEINYPGLAVMSFDDDPETIWHTRWSTGSDPYPHEIQVDMGETYRIYSFTYLTRQDGVNGRIKDYELYISEDAQNWGDPVSTGSFVNTSSPQSINFPEGVIGKYFRLMALSEVNGNAWASAAEFSMVGCTDLTYGVPNRFRMHEVRAFPVPSSGRVGVSLPNDYPLSYIIVSSSGQVNDRGEINTGAEEYYFDIRNYRAGIYFIRLIGNSGTVYHVKVIKE